MDIGNIDPIRLARAAAEAGWTQEKLEKLYLTDVLFQLNISMFPPRMINFPIRKVVTERALEETELGYGMMCRQIRDRLMEANVKTIRQLVTLDEREAVRIFGSSKQNKGYKAIVALLARHNLHFGMRFI